MEEEKYNFVEEVIKEKPGIGKWILSKLLSLLGLMVIFSFGVAVVIILLKDNFKELFYDEEMTSMNKAILNVAHEEETSPGDMQHIEEAINKSVVGVYDKEALLGTGVIVSVADHIYIISEDRNLEKIGENLKVKFYDGTITEAAFWNRDKALDIAAISVDVAKLDEKLIKNLKVAAIAETTDIGRGTQFVYEGNPFSDQILTFVGNIAGIEELTDLYDVNYNFIYTDIILAGVKDGFLFDGRGNLIGIVRQGKNTSNRSISAIAVYDILDIVSKTINLTSIAYIGVQGKVVDYDIQKYMEENLPIGLYVEMVDNASPAFEAGIMKGDIITEIDSVEIEGMRDISNVLEKKKPDEAVEIVLKRKIGKIYKEVVIELVLGQREK